MGLDSHMQYNPSIGMEMELSSNMIFATVKMLPGKEKHRDLLDILLSIKEPVQAEPGCISCCIYEEVSDDPCVFYVEQWQSLPELERHLKSINYSRVLEAMELSTSVPEISFYETAASWGLELVEKVLAAERNKDYMTRPRQVL